MSGRREDLLYDVLAHARPLTRASARVVEATWRVHRVSVGMRAVLAVLDDAGPSPVPEIAARLDLSRQAVQRHVNDLRAVGMVATRLNPSHRRSVFVALTDLGRRLWQAQHRAELDALAPMAAGCSTGDLETAARVLEALEADVLARARKLEVEGV